MRIPIRFTTTALLGLLAACSDPKPAPPPQATTAAPATAAAPTPAAPSISSPSTSSMQPTPSISSVGPAAAPPTPPTTSALVPATLTGGFETYGPDRGRPVVLVAAGLGVAPEVFREAFTRVNPARGGGGPTDQQARDNKRVLMAALGPYGVTNERLDEVSNYYRYPPGDPNLWRHVEAVVKAQVVNGRVAGFTIEKAGAGYTSTPVVSVEGLPGLRAEATVVYGKDLATNGSIGAVKLLAR